VTARASHAGLKTAAEERSREAGWLLQRGDQSSVDNRRCVHGRSSSTAARHDNTGEASRIPQLLQDLRPRRDVVSKAEHRSPSHGFVCVCSHTNAVSIDDREVCKRFAIACALCRCHEQSEAVAARG